MKKAVNALFCLSLVIWVSGCAPGRTVKVKEEAQYDYWQQVVDVSASAIRTLRSDPGNRSLDVLIRNCRGVMIFPSILKGGLIVGGQMGDGVMASRNDDGRWSSPAFFSIGGGSLGFQAGLKRSALIMVFMNDHVFNRALRTGLNLGADASVAAGSNALETSASIQSAQNDIYFFSSVEGIFAGVALEGSVISVRDDINAEYYGEGAAAQGILVERKFEKAETAGLIQALADGN